MNLKTIFKKLILLDLSLFILIIISVFFASEVVLEFNEIVPVPDFFMLIATIWLLAYFINLLLLYKFKSIGKQMYLFMYIIGFVLAFLGGPNASDPWMYVLDGIEMSVAGALLVLLYFTPIKKEFDK
jgi:hypothetical protein|tara:strand:- start:39 stop:419 length:381 start_codon:yes stop_codon:yes gene_type:complete